MATDVTEAPSEPPPTSTAEQLRPAVIVNPTKVADIEEVRRDVSHRAAAAGAAPPVFFETSVDEPGASQARQALAGGANLLIVFGGDGTASACAAAIAGTPTVMALVPCGSGNLLAHNLALPLERGEALDRAFARATPRRLDVLTAGEQSFLVMAGVGFDAALIRDTDEDLKAKVGWLAYFGGAHRALRRSPRVSVTVTLDGQVAFRGRATGVLVGNVGTLRGGMVVFPAARPDDGLLEVVVLTPPSAWHWLPLAWQVLRGRARKAAHATVLQGRCVSIDSDQEVPIEYDGDYTGQTTCVQIEVRPAALWLCWAGSDASV